MIKQIVPIQITLKGDGVSTAFNFALNSVYKNTGGSPFAGTGTSVPTGITIPNPPIPVSTATVDTNGNVIITFQTAIPDKTSIDIQINIEYGSGWSTSTSSSMPQNVYVVNPVTLSGSVAVNNLPSTQPVSIVAMPSTPVTGTFWQASQPVSLTSLPALPAGSAVIGSVSLGNATGKTNVGVTAAKVTTAVTADQAIATYTVTSGKTLYITQVDCAARLTTIATTATTFGTWSLESPAGTKLYTQMAAGAGITAPPAALLPVEPTPIASGTVVRLVCTPAATTSYTWQGNIFGFEK